jgi:hypothetical protein
MSGIVFTRGDGQVNRPDSDGAVRMLQAMRTTPASVLADVAIKPGAQALRCGPAGVSTRGAWHVDRVAGFRRA